MFADVRTRMPNVRDAHLQTPLFAAAVKNEAEMIRFLLKVGADGNARDVDGATALHAAVRALASEAVAALLEGGVELVDAPTAGGSPLAIAQSMQADDIVRMLHDYNMLRYDPPSSSRNFARRGSGPAAMTRAKSPQHANDLKKQSLVKTKKPSVESPETRPSRAFSQSSGGQASVRVAKTKELGGERGV